MLSIEFGIVILFKLSQFSNASHSIVLTESGISIETKL